MQYVYYADHQTSHCVEIKETVCLRPLRCKTDSNGRIFTLVRGFSLTAVSSNSMSRASDTTVTPSSVLREGRSILFKKNCQILQIHRIWD